MSSYKYYITTPTGTVLFDTVTEAQNWREGNGADEGEDYLPILSVEFDGPAPEGGKYDDNW